MAELEVSILIFVVYFFLSSRTRERLRLFVTVFLCKSILIWSPTGMLYYYHALIVNDFILADLLHCFWFLIDV
jgi:hypothetical protein